jgi:YD repeat-containing protein
MGWQLERAGGQLVEKKFTDPVTGGTDRIQQDANGNIISHRRTIRTDLGNGAYSIQSISDPNGAAKTDTTFYNADNQITMRVGDDGSWTRYEYEYHEESQRNRILSITRPIGDAPTNAPPEDLLIIQNNYAPVDSSDDGTFMQHRPRTVTEITAGIPTAKTYYAYYENASGERVEITERAFSGSAAYGDASNQRTTSIYYPVDHAQPYSGEIKSVQRPDGSLTSYTYDKGEFAWTVPALPEVSNLPTNTISILQACHQSHMDHNYPGHGRPSLKAFPCKPRAALRCQRDAMGRTILTEQHILDPRRSQSRIRTMSWSLNELDERGRVIATLDSQGHQTRTQWACCGPERRVDEQGIETTYTYDALDRLVIETRQIGDNMVITQHTYDAAGRRLTSTQMGGGHVMLVSSNTYNLAGHLLASTDAQGITTTYEQGCCGLESTTIRAGITNLTVRYADGRTHYTEQNGIRQQTYVYGLDASSPGHQTTTVYTGPDGTNSPAWQRTTTDFLGRTIRTERPGYNGATLITQNTYNDIGQLIASENRSVNSVNPVNMVILSRTLYQYNALGQQTLTAQDINLNGTIDLAGPDRVSSNATEFVYLTTNDWPAGRSLGEGWYRESRSYTFPEDGSATAILTGTQRQRLTGLGGSSAHGILASESISIDLLGNQTAQQTHINRENAVRKGLVSTPPHQPTNQEQITINGLLISQTSQHRRRPQPTNTTASAAAPSHRTGDINVAPYRLISQITAYDALGRVAYTEDAAGHRTTFAYDDATGQRIATTNALGQATHSAYDPQGRLLATWGATYPVAYEYDHFGRMTAMATTRDNTNEFTNLWDLVPEGETLTSTFNLQPETFDLTQWVYDTATGLLQQKRYADGQGPTYTYTADGKLATRTWARGITTTYDYDPAGQLESVTYSDDTPAVTYTYDRLGRQKTVSQSTVSGLQSAVSFSYNPTTLALETETVVTGGTLRPVRTNIINRTQDPLGRPTGFSLGSDYAVTYGYDPLGRFASLNSSIGSIGSTTSNHWAYTYLPDSGLISGWDNWHNFNPNLRAKPQPHNRHRKQRTGRPRVYPHQLLRLPERRHRPPHRPHRSK